MAATPMFDSAFKELLRRVSELLQQYKKDEFGWRIVLNNHFNRCKELGGPIISSIQDSHKITPAVGGGFMRKLHTKNSLSQDDGNELILDNGSPQRTKAGALDDVCRLAMPVLLLTDASAVLLQPKQWNVPTADVVQAVITTKKEFLEVWTLPNHMSAFGDNMSAFWRHFGRWTSGSTRTEPQLQTRTELQLQTRTAPQVQIQLHTNTFGRRAC